jgi:hypothetical protein
MRILCDTSSLIMLIRIEPDMLTDSRYGCVTARQVWEEFFQTQKFKSKYPWRSNYKRQIRCLSQSAVDTKDYQLALKTAKILESNQRNHRNGKSYGLSRRDLEMAAIAIAHNYSLCSTDASLIDFLEQQYNISNSEPLQIINDWIEEQLFEWNDTRQAVIADWIRCNEKPQSAKEIKRFEALTGYKYPCD